MTSEKDFMGINHWKSERFNKKGEYQTNSVFFEDNDPRIQKITDKWGDDFWVVGYLEEVKFETDYGGGIPKKVLAIRIKDNCLMSFDFSQIA
jgi:hypothetical protein